MIWFKTWLAADCNSSGKNLRLDLGSILKLELILGSTKLSPFQFFSLWRHFFEVFSLSPSPICIPPKKVRDATNIGIGIGIGVGVGIGIGVA